MPTIDQLNSMPSIGDDDLIPVFSVSNGATRRATVGMIADLVEPAATAAAIAGATSDVLTVLDGSDGASKVGYTNNAGITATVQAHLRGDGVTAPAVRGFWVDEGVGANVHRLRDRVLVGDAVLHTARRTAPLGGTWMETMLDGWLEKNSQMIVTSSNGRMALLGASRSGTSTAVGSSIGVSGVAMNDLAGGLAWGMYSDITRKTGAATTYGIEFACKNQGDDVTGNSYSLNGGVLGAHLVAGGDPAYGGAATAPSTVALNIAGRSGGISVASWNMGIRFSAGSITGTDGITGYGVAVAMAKGHTIEWRASDAVAGAAIRSNVSPVAGQDVGIQFDNNLISLRGTGMVATIADFAPVGSGVNNVRFTNAAAGGFPAIAAVGADANIGLFIDAKGTGNIRLRTNGGTAEQFRVSHVASAVNFLSASGGIANNPARMDALGSDANIDIAFAPKGTGVLRLLGVRDYADDTAAAAGGIPVNGIYRTGSILKIRVA